jgi:hypothetical protein
MDQVWRAGLAAAVAVLALTPAGAQAADPSMPRKAEESQDKSRYTLFNPTPDRLLRDFSSDRPDATESPFTVDAGRVQLETTLFSYARSRPDDMGVVTDTYEVGTTNVRIGLTHNTEFNVVWQPYGLVRTFDPAGPVPRQHGIGGLDLRMKFNLWGNDKFEKAGDTALGLLPYVSLPTDRKNGISPEYVEAGLLIPFAVKLTDKFGLGLNAGVAAVHNENNTRYHAEWIASASVSYEWTEALGTYYEIGGRFGLDDPRGDIVFVGTGVTYKLNKNLQLDAGVNFGLTDAADRINPFVGITARF